MREYYKAYDDRYRQIHGQNLHWFDERPTPIVQEILARYKISQAGSLLEIGCGEGRDAFALMDTGWAVTATDVSDAAVSFCKTARPEYEESFRALDCLKDTLNQTFDFLYAVALVHMLVPDRDRSIFYRFVREHLRENGIGLICTMGDGVMERRTDIANAFELQDRVHEQSGREVRIASTSCRVVNFDTFHKELKDNGLTILESGLTACEPDFPMMMYAVVKRA